MEILVNFKIEILYQVLKNWWWFFFPLFFYPIARYFYFWWIRWEIFYKKWEWMMLELIPPDEVKKPFSAMEQVFSTFWNILFDGPNWKQRWCEGALLQGYGSWASIEICSFGGEIHFYLRILKEKRDAIEAAIYSQYPDIEILEVDDYTQKVPRDIPNEKYDFYSEDYTLMKDDHLPIKVYSRFFELPAEEKRVIEEKRIDPMNALLETLSKLKEGDQIWFQIVFTPVVEDPWNWKNKGKAEIEKITKRASPQKKKSFLVEMIDTILFGPPPAKKSEKSELIAPELRMTPAEKDLLSSIEKKLEKQNFQCWLRSVCLTRKDKPFTPGLQGLVREYITGQFSYYNWLVFYGGTRSRIHYFLRERRLYLRKRQRLRGYIRRLPSLWPRTFYGTSPSGFIRRAPGSKSVCILSTEELATIFHFPAKIFIPTLKKVKVKKVGPPPFLPTK